MILHKTPPDLAVYTPDRRQILSNIWSPYDMSIDYNFGTASQMSFSVQKYIYNTRTEEWIENPCYKYLETDMLIKSTDNDDYFRFKGYTPVQNYSCQASHARSDVNTRYYCSSNLNGNTSFRDEIQLYDIGSEYGYVWNVGCYINSGAYIDGTDNMSSYYNRIACKEFFPVEEGDIIALVSKVSENGDGKYIADKNGTVHFQYYIDTYDDADAAKWNKQVITNHTADPISRIRVSSSWFSNGNKKGYIRFSAGNPLATYTTDGNSFSWTASQPAYGYVIIYSGERHCCSIECNSVGEQKVKIPWWIITNIEENTDNINFTKTVTAYSYEYVLSNKTFSLSEGTFPLYTPPNLYDLVNSSNWLYDAYTNSNNSIASSHGSQRMKKGLINQITEWLPNWNIGYISQGLSTKYRTFDDVDNANIYSFLTNEIQSKFNCFVIFDTDSMTINLVSKNDCILESNTALTWDNALKSMKITNEDNRFVTAMRVHTSDDSYGLGLINPTGNNILYNFSAYQDYMNFVADRSKNRTLWEAVCSVIKNIDTYSDNYRNYARTVIEQNLEIIKLETKLTEALTNYRSKADMINVFLREDYGSDTLPTNYYISDIPRSSWEMKYGNNYKPTAKYKNYHSYHLYKELYDLAVAYEGVRASYEDAVEKYNEAYSKMQEIAKKTSINTSYANSDLSEIELKALSYFIVEGDWSNPNATFSDTYSADDIFDTLVEVYDDAKSELNSIYSKRNYDFSVDTANILAIDEMEDCISELSLGNSLKIFRENEWITPVLLSIHIDYNDLSNFTMSFSTDYNRQPLSLRFTKLFGTINQTSVNTPTFTFDN